MTGACNAILGGEEGRFDPGVNLPGEDVVDGSADDAADGTTTTPPPITDAGTADRNTPIVDANTPETDARSDGGPVDPTCTTRVVDADQVFVTTSGSDTATCGTPSAPCRTVQAAMGRAMNRLKSKVYLGKGTYTEAVTLVSGITLEGGWEVLSSKWAPVCTGIPNEAATIQAPENNNTTVTAEFGSGGTATLNTLRVKSRPPEPADGGSYQYEKSLYGIVARGAQTVLKLQNVAVDVATAGAGDNGSDGYQPGTAGAGCQPGTGGGSLDAGSSGTGATAGTFSNYGYQPSQGGYANGGDQGIAGSAGGAATCVSCVYCQENYNLDGGGGTGTCSAVPGQDQCGQVGQSGCGGYGGGGGGGGSGGGASIALFVWDAKVTTEGGSLTAHKGGAGGAGGKAGAAGLRGAGQPGGAGYPCPSACGAFEFGYCPADQSSYRSGTGGSTGGPGSIGSAGGVGGGGAGGPSYCIYKGGTAVVTTMGMTALVHETGGLGGTGGASGATGASGNQN